MKPENEMQKKKYQPASVEIIWFEAQDIITTSSGTGIINDEPGIDLPIDPV